MSNFTILLSLFHHYFCFFFFCTERLIQKKIRKKGWLWYHHHLAPLPEESSLYQRYHHLLIPRPEKSLSFEKHQVEISLEDPRSIVSAGPSSALMTEDFTEVFPDWDINVTTPNKYPLMEELGVLIELVDNM